MFNYFYEWLRNLAFYMVLMTAVLHLIPNKSYEKYIRFFCGLILVILLMTPVMKVMDAGFEGRIRDSVSDDNWKELEKIREEAEEMEDFVDSFSGEEQNGEE
ncbi:MAG: stage III sporulation protein AF [Bariatricus sp.]